MARDRTFVWACTRCSSFSSHNAWRMDVGAIQAASVATTASYRSFADATRSVLDLLEAHLPDATLFLSHLDRGHNVHRIVDTRGGETFGLQANQATPLRDSYCGRMAEDLGPRRCDDLARRPGLRAARRCSSSSAPSPTSASRSSCPTASRVGSLAALSRTPARFTDADEQLFAVLARVLVVASSSARARPATCSGCRRPCASTPAGSPRSAA